MENCLNKYFADEFTSDEKTEFLIEVENNERLKEEFIENYGAQYKMWHGQNVGRST